MSQTKKTVACLKSNILA